MLENPMHVDQIDIAKQLSKNLPSIHMVTEEEYTLIQIPDPNHIYVITDSEDRKIYLGEVLIMNNRPKRLYLIGSSNSFGEYTMYLNITRGFENELIEIAKYYNAQDAIEALNVFNRVGGHDQLTLQTHTIICQYIQKELSLNDMLIGIISIFGYKDDLRLQEVIMSTKMLGAHHYKETLPVLLIEEVVNWKYSPSPLYVAYSLLYDLVVRKEFFKSKEFRFKEIEDLNLSEVIEEVFVIMIGTPLS